MPMRTIQAWALAIGLGCVAPLANAQDASPKSMAQTLFDQGVSLTEARRYDEAIGKFEASFRLDPARGALQGWATAEERSGRLLEAVAHFRQLEKWALDANDQERASLARQRIQSIDARLPRLTLEIVGATPPGAGIEIDGVAVLPSAFGAPVPVNPGSHVVRGSTPDGWAFSQMVSVAERASSRVRVEWNRRAAVSAEGTPGPAPDRRPRGTAPNTRRTVGYVVTGAGAVLLGVGAYSLVQVISSKNDPAYDDYRKTTPAGTNTCNMAASQGRKDIVDICDTNKKYTTLFYITAPVGVVATGAGIYLLATSGGDSEGARLRVTPAAGPRAGYLDVSYRF